MILKKIIITTLLLVASTVAMSETNEWKNEIKAENKKFTFTSNVTTGVNQFEYNCSVFKFNSSLFGKTEDINLDLDLKLEEDKLTFQEEYNVNLKFSSGKTFKNKLKITKGEKGLDRFKIFLDTKSDVRDDSLLSNLTRSKYVNIEVLDNNKKRVLYRFYLNNSYNSIKESQQNCDSLYNTFK